MTALAKQVQTKGIEISEWKKYKKNNQEEYLRHRLDAIKYIYETGSIKKVHKELGYAEKSLRRWAATYCLGGFTLLCEKITKDRESNLGRENEILLREILLNKKPSDYGFTEHIWSGQLIADLILKEWNVKYTKFGVYAMLHKMGLSYQKAHRDYANADIEQQKIFTNELFNYILTQPEDEKLVFFDEFSVTERPACFYAWAPLNTRPQVKSDEKKESG